MDITYEIVKRWAESSELDVEFDRLRDEIQEFDDSVLAVCDNSQLLAFAADRKGLKRRYFASELVRRLVSSLYSPAWLPYPFSRMQGMMPLEEFKTKELERIENVYQQCRIVEEMRTSEQEEIKNLGDMILDYRHDRRLPHASTSKLVQLLDHQIGISLRVGVTSYVLRLCTECEDGFKSWIEAGQEVQTEKCPFCLLGIAYPQKTGKNAR